MRIGEKGREEERDNEEAMVRIDYRDCKRKGKTIRLKGKRKGFYFKG